MQNDLLSRFQTALPMVRDWIDATLSLHAAEARPALAEGYPRLPLWFPGELLERAKVVELDPVPLPPLEHFKLPELMMAKSMQVNGITLRDTFFIRPAAKSESIYFHELVHVVQWDYLGPDRFLFAYGLGLATCSYATSPLEQMAYTLQARFDRDQTAGNVVAIIEAQTEAIWAQLAPVYRSRG